MDLATDQATSLSLARIVLGGAAWVAPERALRATMLDPAAQSPYLLRLFGARDVALGAITLMAAPSLKPTMLKIGIAVDAADAAAGALATRSGAVRPLTGALVTGAAAAAVVAGVVALGQQ